MFISLPYLLRAVSFSLLNLSLSLQFSHTLSAISPIYT